MTKIISLPKILDDRGNLTFIQGVDQIPFQIKRVYWIYEVPGGEVRGGHAYKKLQEIIISLSGSFDVLTDDGVGGKKVYQLNRSYKGLYIPGMNWRKLANFSTNSVALILASRPFEPKDYIYNYNDFTDLKNN